MVTLKDFETYKVSTTSFKIYSLQEGEWKPLKGEEQGAHIYFTLWKNGNKTRVSLWSIIRNNWIAISADIQGARQDH